MADPSPLDPVALWRDLVSQWERGVNDLANRAMASDEFNRSMHGGLGVSLTAQKAFGDALGRVLTSLNLPTRNEITALGDRLQSIEERLIQIAAALDQSAGGASASAPPALAPMPRRTKRPAPRQSAQPAAAEPTQSPSESEPATRRKARRAVDQKIEQAAREPDSGPRTAPRRSRKATS